MSPLLAIRQQQNLTQEELYERSGISVRTIQRIEAGTQPQGFTLKALAKALDVSEDELAGKQEAMNAEHTKWLKLINFSALPFMLVPPLNIAVPLFIMFIKKEFNAETRKLVTIQIVWALLAGVLSLMVVILNDWFAIRSKYMMLIPVLWLAVNIFIILRNAVSIAKNQTLRVDLNFSLI
jgi:transcriptional regulator with XRE-family HTH domain